MIKLSSHNKFLITFLFLIAIVYWYRAVHSRHSFSEEISINVHQCMDAKLQSLLSSHYSDHEIVDIALSSCKRDINEWLKDYTMNEDENSMTLSYLKEYYMFEIKYSRQPETSGQNHS